ncbi:MAG: hypothetical protein ACI4QT_08820 [Kiritimatiellia bacterium]
MKTILRMVVPGFACAAVLTGCFSIGEKAAPVQRFLLEADRVAVEMPSKAAKTMEEKSLPVLAIGRFRGALEASERVIRWVDARNLRTGRLADGEFAQPAVDFLKSALQSGLGEVPGYWLIADAGIVSTARENADLLEGWMEQCRLVRDPDGYWRAEMRIQFLLYRNGVLEREFRIRSERSSGMAGVPAAETAVGLFRGTLADVLQQVKAQLTAK